MVEQHAAEAAQLKLGRILEILRFYDGCGCRGATRSGQSKSCLAILVSDGKREVWLPKSAIVYRPAEPYQETTVTLPIPLAQEKELI